MNENTLYLSQDKVYNPLLAIKGSHGGIMPERTSIMDFDIVMR